jgi:hypothetical protein
MKARNRKNIFQERKQGIQQEKEEENSQDSQYPHRDLIPWLPKYEAGALPLDHDVRWKQKESEGKRDKEGKQRKKITRCIMVAKQKLGKFSFPNYDRKYGMR